MAMAVAVHYSADRLSKQKKIPYYLFVCSIHMPIPLSCSLLGLNGIIFCSCPLTSIINFFFYFLFLFYFYKTNYSLFTINYYITNVIIYSIITPTFIIIITFKLLFIIIII